MNKCILNIFASPVAAMLLMPFAQPAIADVKLPAVFGSHMVLQRELPIQIWGWSEPGEKVTVRLDDHVASTQGDAEGNWRVTLEPMKSDGKAHVLAVTGKNQVVSEDILIGEVWLGSGQSNMARGIGNKAGVGANQPEIRLFNVPPNFSKVPLRDVSAIWSCCTEQTVTNFSEVLYYFGDRLHHELNVPIGLINSSRGSQAIEVFLPPPTAGPLYNGAIAPLIPFTLRGMIWYQGEANVQRRDGFSYAAKQTALINGWRKAWGRDFSFYLVQLAPFSGYKTNCDLAPLWEAQLTGLKMPHVGVAVINDTAGNMKTIHPGNKDKVGQRLAGWALAKDYGRTDIEYCSPMLKSSEVEGKKIRLFFSHAKGLRASDGQPLTEFEIAGKDGQYVPAQASIDGETVVVESPAVTSPVTVRYAWRNTPAVNLVNGAGLPASAFHTDNWQGGTAE